MSASIPSTPVCYIDQLGIHAPTYSDVLTYLQGQYQAIYGADVYLGNDSQDGQFLALLASAIHDTNSSVVAVYQAFSPATAFGANLSSVAKINNLRRLIATNSTVDLLIVGQAGTTIINGVVRDQNNNNWLLPATVVVPTTGSITVTAVAATQGQINAGANTVTTIATPTRGWQSVTNVNPATAGDPLETDAALRLRQAVSTALPSQTVLDGMFGTIFGVPGVLRLVIYENDSNVTDANGVPGNSIAVVADGGDAQQIAQQMMLKKTPGAGTYGTTTELVEDSQGILHTINFFRPSLVPVSVAITVAPLAGFTNSTTALISAGIAAFISGLPIGTDVFRTALFGPSYLPGTTLGTTYNVTDIQIARNGAPADQDVPIAFNEAATCTANNINITVLVNP